MTFGHDLHRKCITLLYELWDYAGSDGVTRIHEREKVGLLSCYLPKASFIYIYLFACILIYFSHILNRINLVNLHICYLLCGVVNEIYSF